ncbi:SAM dependent methyltransferase [Histoplasma capsulatum]|uniref:SAM dependent methyltransferase n=1 Tax=Ajellomyces capsulatus TaxID=5037 RepID=A0A8A1MKC5_AJECA|nr:SAM dependent methyltransferase [Histoplasma capsulatum]
MTSSGTQARKSTFYDSAYNADYYDIWAEENGKTLDLKDGVPAYPPVFKEQLSSRSPKPSAEAPFAVLDVGTGTGRILIDLANAGERDELDLSNVHFIGVDTEQAMLDRAEKSQATLASMARVGKIVWSSGNATTVASLPALENYAGGIDLLIFAAGSISHLTGPEEPQRFFAQAASLLRPGSGRVYFPIMNAFISNRSISQEPVAPKTQSTLQQLGEFPSKTFPNITYKKFPFDDIKVEGNIRTHYHNFHVIRKLESGEEEVVQNDRVTFSLRAWEEPELLEWTKDAGLEFVETFHGQRDTSYVFKLKE